jgi:hypothetical protein
MMWGTWLGMRMPQAGALLGALDMSTQISRR